MSRSPRRYPSGAAGRKGPAVERAVAADDAVTLGMPGLGLIFPRNLDRQLTGLGAGIAEEHSVGKGIVDKTLRQLFLARNAEQVGGVPQPLGLLGKSGNDMRVAVTKPGHCDAACKIEEFTAVGSVKVEALAPVDGDVPPTIGRHNSWDHGISPARFMLRKSSGRRGLSSSPVSRRRDLPHPSRTPAPSAGIAHH